MIELSRQARRALDGLRKEARGVQRGGAVLSARKILECGEVLRDDLDRLEQERKQLLEQLTAGRAEESKLQDEIVKLRNALADCDHEEVDGEDHSLPEDYWETAQ